ncbi:hypothetical protein HanIR_Chr09g0421691 [Helianthus annuus]|nr:hypothetical protein HanIR_Chr09g0421691 [Helianthus annuus]
MITKRIPAISSCFLLVLSYFQAFLAVSNRLFSGSVRFPASSRSHLGAFNYLGTQS